MADKRGINIGSVEEGMGKRIVVKVGTSTLTYESGKLNIRRIEMLARVLSDLQNAGNRIILVSSGAMGVGVGKLGLRERPHDTPMRQAVAAVGQCELMFIYDKMFGEYNRMVAQMLLTKDVVDNEVSNRNVTNAIETLLEMDMIPIVNENDTVATDELVGQNFGDNDTLSALVAKIAKADCLVILTDIDGLYDSNPRENPNAKRIPVVKRVDDSILQIAGGSGSSRGTGGMLTKVQAARIANDAGIDVYVARGDDPEILYRLMDGEQVGTLFCGKKAE